MHSSSRWFTAVLLMGSLAGAQRVRAAEASPPVLDDAQASADAHNEAVRELEGGDAEDANPPLDISEMLDPDDIPDNSANLSTDVDRWGLHDVLEHDIAATRDWKTTLRSRSLLTLTVPTLGWQEQMDERRLLSLFSGQPEQHHQLDMAGMHFDIPLADHPLVDVYIDYFTGRGRGFFQTWLGRASRYVPAMQRILADKGVPQDLVYLAMIESGFSAKAYSTAAAAGYWQFIGSTGKIFGLKHDMWVDERRDFIRATEAAATYLAQLYRGLGDWHLAWAGYNAGEGRVRRALGKYKESDFWGLIAHKKSLAKETVHYVPKIIAAAIVAKDAERYGFKLADITRDPIAYDEISVSDATDLRVIAKRASVSLEELRDLNPALLHDITPPGRSVRLRVPKGTGDNITAVLASLPPSQRFTYQQHKVRSGDTLSGIARRYRSDVETIKIFNHLRSNALRINQDLVVPSLYRGEAVASSVVATSSRAAKTNKATSRARASSASQPMARHVVSSGETLWSIARRYGVTVDRIKKHRSGRGSQIMVGEVLDIF